MKQLIIKLKDKFDTKQYKMSKEENAFAALCYVFPMQIVVFFMGIIAGFWTEYLRRHAMKSTIMYSLVFIINFCAIMLNNFTFETQYYSYIKILLIINFALTCIFFIYLFIRIILIANGKRI